MVPDQIIVILVGVGFSFWVAWYFWFSEKKSVKIETSARGFQEAQILVKGGYTPNVLVLDTGIPIKLNFVRLETAACTEEVIFPDFNKKASLTPYKTIPVELNIEQPGEYIFQCGMGMVKGKLIVK